VPDSVRGCVALEELYLHGNRLVRTEECTEVLKAAFGEQLLFRLN
jgi:hypothetical protein